MLLAKYAIGGETGKSAEVTVSVFPGETGGLLANVNRWRRQISLGEVSDSELPALTSSLDVDGAEAILVDMPGSDPKTGQAARLVAAIVPRQGQTWFYKMMGDDELAAREKSGFLTFVQSARYADVP
jgi:hypothetical protein